MTSLPAGTYTITVTQAGAPSTTLFSGSLKLSVSMPYSFTVEDAATGSSSFVQVIAAINQPLQVANQANLSTAARRSSPDSAYGCRRRAVEPRVHLTVALTACGPHRRRHHVPALQAA